MVYNSQGKSRGMAVVTFARPGDAAVARAKYNGKIVDGSECPYLFYCAKGGSAGVPAVKRCGEARHEVRPSDLLRVPSSRSGTFCSGNAVCAAPVNRPKGSRRRVGSVRRSGNFGDGVMGLSSDGTFPPVVVPVYFPNTPLLHVL